MYNYFVGGLFLFSSILFFYLLGIAILKHNQSLPKNILVGYLVYNLMIAIVLIPIQLLVLPWSFACVYVVLLSISCFIFSIIRIKKYKIKLIEVSLKHMIKKYYFLIILAILLFFIFLMQLDLIWINNHLDDGYYLVRIATLPFEDHLFSVTHATGLTENYGAFNTYALNVFELEASIYVYLLHLDPSVYCRIVLNTFNYFLAICTVYVLAETIIQSTKIKIKESFIQYLPIVLVIFSFDARVMQETGLLVVQDSWQFNSAMWYGSSLVRVLGILWIILPFIKNDKITFWDIVKVGSISLVLISKSSIALPVIFISGIAYLIAFFFTNGNKKWMILSAFIIVLMIVLGYFLPNNEYIETLINQLFEINKYSILLWGCFISILVFVFKNKNKISIRFSIILLVVLAFIALPEVNDSFELISMYDFVARRAQTTFYYTFVMFGYISFMILLYQYAPKFYKGVNILFCITLVVLSVASYTVANGNPLHSYNVMAHNYRLFPNSTIELGEELNDLALDEINVMMPQWVMSEGNRHALSVVVRTYAPKVKSISAIVRFGVTEGSEFSSFEVEDQDAYEQFRANPNDETFNALAKVLEKYPITALVFDSDIFEAYANGVGFEYVKTTNYGYRIYQKKL